MSCDWNVHCLDCHETLSFSDANHQEKLMWQLVRAASSIAGMVDLVAEGDVWIETSFGQVDPGFFKKHSEHRLVPISEYGDVRAIMRCELCKKEAEKFRLESIGYGKSLLCEECAESLSEWVRSRSSHA